jgi:hypothetical protein
MLLIVMNTSPPRGWKNSNKKIKSFKIRDESSDSDTDSGSSTDTEEDKNIRGYEKTQYKKLAFVEDLLPE